MTQSKDEFTINLDELGLGDLLSDDTITINLDDTYGTTTSYWAGDSVSDITVSEISDNTFTLSGSDTVTISGYDTDISTDWVYTTNNIDPSEVERMCNEYPALEKVWRNFKSVYDMVKQDFEGKKKAGEIDDDIPF